MRTFSKHTEKILLETSSANVNSYGFSVKKKKIVFFSFISFSHILLLLFCPLQRFRLLCIAYQSNKHRKMDKAANENATDECEIEKIWNSTFDEQQILL